MINVTGCLKKDGGTGGFYVTDEGGRTWALTSKTIELAKHLNQVVSVAGPDRLRSNQSETNHQNQKQGTTVFADMQVKQLEVVSPSCTR